MTVEKTYSKKFNSFLEELLRDKEKYTSQLSIVDKQLTDCLHFLENEEVNEIILEKVAKIIMELRRVRRQIKNNLTDVNNVLNKFKNIKKMNETAECEYQYRTDILLDIISE